jgi:UDP-N-acetylmuramoyl-tripeptide--D-alanyl-D-alanine ligase
MTAMLWTLEALAAAARAQLDGDARAAVQGISIDTRTLAPGDLFVALRDVRDGHDFVPSAFAVNAAAALVETGYQRKPGDGPLLRVADTLAGLVEIARASRARSPARIVAVTGSVGKTGTKEMLRTVLSRLGPTHAAEKSFNNHWGVPLTLARLPAQSAFGVFEIGMNHAGEITPLTRMVRPDVAIVTTVEAVHIENFASIEGIAEAKAEIFLGLEPGGTAVVNRDNPWHGLLTERARAVGANLLTFGRDPASDVRAVGVDLGPDGSKITAEHAGVRYAWRLGAPGAHLAQNSLAVLSALIALGLDRTRIDEALQALAASTAPPGRGARTTFKSGDGSFLLIDESYNANPTSVRAALATVGMVPRASFSRRIAVLGDMLELGPEAQSLHIGLAEAVDAAGIDLVFAAGPMMRGLFDKIDPARRGAWANTSSEIEAPLLDALRGGDVVMIKGSFGSRMGPLVAAIRSKFAVAD